MKFILIKVDYNFTSITRFLILIFPVHLRKLLQFLQEGYHELLKVLNIFSSIAEHQKQHLLTSAQFHSILQSIKEFQFQLSVTIDEFNLQAHELILFIVIIFLSNHLELNFKIINPITLNTALLPFLAAFSTIHCHFITAISLIQLHLVQCHHERQLIILFFKSANSINQVALIVINLINFIKHVNLIIIIIFLTSRQLLVIHLRHHQSCLKISTNHLSFIIQLILFIT